MGLSNLNQERKERGALKQINHPETNAFFASEAKLNEAKTPEERNTLAQAHDKAVCALLRSDKIQTFEKVAPNIINKAREELYSKHLTPAQSELLLHPEWPKLETIADKQLRERVVLLTKVKEQIFDNLHDKKTTEQLMSPLASLFDKIITSKHQKKEFEKIAPGLYQKARANLGKISVKYNRQHELGIERDR